MINVFKKTVYGIGMMVLLFSFFAQSVEAVGVPFGGFNVIQIPCTCTGGSLYWSLFAPFFNPSTPSVGALVYQLGIIGFESYYLSPGAWALGFETPGVGICLFGVEPYCYTLPNYGFIGVVTGTSPL